MGLEVNKPPLSKALQLLMERNLLSAPIKLPTRKPTTIYCIHSGIMPGDNK